VTRNEDDEESDLMSSVMSAAWVRFYAELNDFLPLHRKQVAFAHPLRGQVSVKDFIESLGVPHTEVDLILVNGESVDFTYRVKAADRISVYPVFESMDIRPLLQVRPEPLRETKFVLDVHLGRLSAYLRMSGFDAYYRNNSHDEELARISSVEKRILLTRDRGLLKRSLVSHGYWVRQTRPRQQLQEVLQRFDLLNSLQPFRRCLQCNAIVVSVAKETVSDRLPPNVRHTQDEFQLCPQCHRVYWKGSHYQRMQHLIQGLVKVP
jgi:uncharacterized protein